jgi:hypothetical protein
MKLDTIVHGVIVASIVCFIGGIIKCLYLLLTLL